MKSKIKKKEKLGKPHSDLKEKSKYPDLLPFFKVIIANFSQGNINNNEVYSTGVQPNT
ncbi:MAG: hypothetical protein ACFFHD_01950 [Promethearchaeota archaeon]